jgi:hypothetical protein
MSLRKQEKPFIFRFLAPSKVCRSSNAYVVGVAAFFDEMVMLAWLGGEAVRRFLQS